MTAISLDVAVTRPSLMLVGCGGLGGRRKWRWLLKKLSSLGCTGTEVLTDSFMSLHVATHRNWRK